MPLTLDGQKADAKVQIIHETQHITTESCIVFKSF